MEMFLCETCVLREIATDWRKHFIIRALHIMEGKKDCRCGIDATFAIIVS
jgi:hypothetical protein